MSGGALGGVKVLDLSRVLAGPYCTAIMADMGAEVIKIEEPGVGDESRLLRPMSNGESGYFINFNRGKKGITLNLKTGKEIFLKMVKTADIVVENYRPGVMKKLGLDYDVLKQVNPRIIYVAVSGYGQDGPNSQLPGYDPVAQAMSGICSVTGWPDADPVRCGAPVADVMAGLNAAIGALAALHYREATGEGQMVDVSLVDVSVSALSSLNQVYLSENRIPNRQGNGTEAAAPGGTCHAKDGIVIFAAGNDKLFNKLCKLMGKEELATDERYEKNEQRVLRRKELEELVDGWAATFTVDEVVEMFRTTGIPSGPVYNIEQVVKDPHISGARKMFITVEQAVSGPVTITNSAIKMSATNPEAAGGAPALGQNNYEVYNELLGLDEMELQDLKAQGVI